uniref:Mobile element protein n=1 Tax=Salmonella enterica subsp. enterica serovar Indiana TaxID=286783 RepID=A0A1C9T7S2_SALET|nr:Mobile element protein [Salmonella enterica subsp. enterica serovar Indiana]
MGSCAAPSAKGDDKFITTDYLQQCLSVCHDRIQSRCSGT